MANQDHSYLLRTRNQRSSNNCNRNYTLCFILGISQITSDQESVFTVSNLVRKIKLESESQLRPTPARAQVPNDCQDGTLSLCALSNVSKKSSSKTNFVVLSRYVCTYFPYCKNIKGGAKKNSVDSLSLPLKLSVPVSSSQKRKT